MAMVSRAMVSMAMVSRAMVGIGIPCDHCVKAHGPRVYTSRLHL